MFKYNLNGRSVSIAEIQLSLGLLIAVIITLIIQYHYYHELFVLADRFARPVVVIIALGLGLLIQLMRLGFVFAGVEEFASGRKRAGNLGFVFSALLSVYETVEMYFVVTHWWKLEYFVPAMMALQFLVWAAFALELRWALNVSAKSSKSDDGFSFNGTAKNSRSKNGEYAYN